MDNLTAKRKCIALTLLILILSLTVSGASAALQSAAATPTSVTLTWTAPGDDGSSGQATQYDIRYSTSPIDDGSFASATAIANPPTPQPAGQIESFEVTGLTPSTTYYFAIKTADEIPNWSTLSNVVSKATTAETTPPAIVADLSVDAVTPGSATLIWTAPGDDGNIGTASEYEIRHYDSPITESNWADAWAVTGEPVPGTAGSQEQFTVTGLTASTTYYFALKTADEASNWSGVSNSPSGTTSPENTAPAAVANLTAVSPAESTLTLVWTSPGDDGTTGRADQYDLRMSTSPITTSNFDQAAQIPGLAQPKVAGSAESYDVGGLVPNTTYYFALKTADEVPNWSDMSNVASGTTAQDQIPPAAIDDLQAATGSQEGEILLSWTATGDDSSDGTATAYEVRYADQPFTPAAWLDQPVYFASNPLPPGQTETLTLTALDPGHMYWVGVRVFDDAGNPSLPSNIVSAEAYIKLGTDIGDPDQSGLPDEYMLAQNYPNPFNPSTAIAYALPEESHVIIDIFNVQGRRIRTLVDETQPAGSHTVEWDGTASGGTHVASGIYFYRITARDFTATRKMAFVK